MNFSLLLNSTHTTVEQTGNLQSLFEANGKIGVVILVLSTIFIGLMVILFLLDKKIKKMEDQLNTKA